MLNYTKVNDIQINMLAKLKLRSSLILVYLTISRFHNTSIYKNNPSYIIMPASKISKITGYHVKSISRMIKELCTIKFNDDETILKVISSGRNSKCSIYDDRLWLYSQNLLNDNMEKHDG